MHIHMNDLEVSQIGGYPKIIHSRIFHYQPSILRGSPIPGALHSLFEPFLPGETPVEVRVDSFHLAMSAAEGEEVHMKYPSKTQNEQIQY